MTWLKRRYFAELPDEVLALTGVSFSVALGFGIVAPVVPVFARSFHVSAFQASAVVSVFALMRFVSAGPSGWLVNRLGERTVLWSGLSIVALSSAMAGLSHSFEQLLVLRSLGGTGSSMFTVSAMSLLLRVTPSHHRGRAASRYQSGFLLGGIAGPAVGGLVVGISLRAPFFVYSATLLMAAVVASTMLPRRTSTEREATDGTPEQAPLAVKSAVRLAEYRAAIGLNMATGVVIFGMRSALLPLYVVEILHRGPGISSSGWLASSISQVLCLRIAGDMVDNRGRKPALTIGISTLGIAVAILLAQETTPAYFVYMIAVGVAGAFLGAGGAAVVGDIVSGRKGGQVVSTFQMTGDLGMIIGPLLAGWLLDASGAYTLPFALSLGLVLAVCVLVIRMPETRQRHYLKQD